MPFKLDSGEFYFVTVEFISQLKKHHYQNYIALCPNHAAMFQYANGSSEFLTDTFEENENNELEIILAQKDASIYFTATHQLDIRSIIFSDRKLRENEPDVSDLDDS